jgi:hypothetical protein
LRVASPKVAALIFVPTAEAAARIILKEMAEIHVTKPIIGEVNLCDFPFSPADFGLHGACVAARFETREFSKFFKEYVALNKHPPYAPFYDAMTYDLAAFLNKAGEKIDFSTPSGVQELQRRILAGFGGTITSYSFTANGEPAESRRYLSWKTFGPAR